MSTDPSSLPPLPKNHLSHPENWATGSEPITSNQEGFIKVLEKQKPDLAPEGGIDTASLSKSDASDVIDKLKKGEQVGEAANDSEVHVETGGRTSATVEEKNGGDAEKKHKEKDDGEKEADEGKEELSKSTKRKEPTDEATKASESNVKESSAATGDKASGGKAEVAGKTSNGEKKENAEEADEHSRPAKKARNDGETDKALVEETKAKGTEEEVVQGESTEDPIEVDTPPQEKLETPAEPESDKLPAATNGASGKAGNGNGHVEKSAGAGQGDATIPGDEAHLDHPENWATGGEPATDKQKGFIKVLEKQKGAPGVAGDVDNLGKSEASEKIDELKHM